MESTPLPPETIWDTNPLLFLLKSYKMWLKTIIKHW